MEIGLIAYGFVNKAVHNMLDKHEVSIYDPALGYNLLPLHTEAIFIAVPTPTEKGKRDHSILESTLNLLEQSKYTGLVIIKSTISPNICKNLNNYNLDIMVAPEFLDQFQPYASFTKHLIGVKNIHQAQTYRKIFNLQGYGHTDIRTTNIVTAVMAKNCHNVHGAVKVALFNLFFDICEQEGVSYREMLQCIFSMNDNINAQYTRIAADGKRGFGGACFTKDIIALAGEYNNNILNATIEENKKWRLKEMSKCL